MADTAWAFTNHNEIAVRYAWHSRQRKFDRGSPKLIARIRMREIERLIADRYNGALPDDDAGLDDLELVAHHIAHLAGDAEKHILAWASMWAPWLWHRADIDPAQFAQRIAANPRRFKAGTLALRLRLMADDRTRLGITTIRPVGWTDQMMAAHRQRSKRIAATTRRRAAGSAPREESAARRQPWLAMSMSRSKWYRLGKPSPETTSCPAEEITTMVSTQSSHGIVPAREEVALREDDQSSGKASVPAFVPERPVPAMEPHLAEAWLLTEIGDIAHLAGGKRRFDFLRRELIAGTLYPSAIWAASRRMEIAA